MKERVFVDSDVCLDLLLARYPHHIPAATLFSMADAGKITLFVSAVAFANIHYLLLREYSLSIAKNKIMQFKALVNVLSVDDKIIELALHSDFKDFEDGIQYYTAIETGLKVLLTRNLKDYKPAKIAIMTPESYLKTLSR